MASRFRRTGTLITFFFIRLCVTVPPLPAEPRCVANTQPFIWPMGSKFITVCLVPYLARLDASMFAICDRFHVCVVSLLTYSPSRPSVPWDPQGILNLNVLLAQHTNTLTEWRTLFDINIIRFHPSTFINSPHHQ